MKTGLLEKFRRRIIDVRYSIRGLGLSVIAPETGTPTAVAEITNGRLVVTVMGYSGVPSLDISLSDHKYDTLDKLRAVLDRTNGYRCSADEDICGGHPSSDLEHFGPVSILGVGIDLRHHIFSDIELLEILEDAIHRHNPSLGVHTLPPGEEPLVLNLAHASVCRVMAQDAVKRRTSDKTVQELLSLASSFEEAYNSDAKRLLKALAPARETSPGTVREGDIMLGGMFRKSPRTGYRSPLSQSTPPDPAVLLVPGDFDVEDDNIKVVWQKNRSPNFYSYELWIDTTPEVVRANFGNQAFNQPYSSSYGMNDSATTRRTTSRMVFRSHGGNSNFDLAAFASFIEQLGQGVTAFAVGKLEPSTEYFFRLFVTDLNYEGVASDVVSAKTKPLRVRFASSWTSNTTAAIGQQITLNFDSRYGAFSEATHKIDIEGKPVTVVSSTPTSALIVVPSFFQLEELKTVTVRGPDGLFDTMSQALRVTS